MAAIKDVKAAELDPSLRVDMLTEIEDVRNLPAFLVGADLELLTAGDAAARVDSLAGMASSKLADFAELCGFDAVEAPPTDRDRQKWNAHWLNVVRLFLLSFMYGLLYRSTDNKSLDQLGWNVVLIPFRDLVLSPTHAKDAQPPIGWSTNYGSFGAYIDVSSLNPALNGELLPRELRLAFGSVFATLAAIESEAERSQVHLRGTELERVCRLSCFLNDETAAEINLFRRKLDDCVCRWVKREVPAASQGDSRSHFTENALAKEEDKKPGASKRVARHTAVSRSQLDILEQGFARLMFDQPSRHKPYVIFMYGESGTGKGTLAELFHLLSDRSGWRLDHLSEGDRTKTRMYARLDRYYCDFPGRAYPQEQGEMAVLSKDKGTVAWYAEQLRRGGLRPELATLADSVASPDRKKWQDIIISKDGVINKVIGFLVNNPMSSFFGLNAAALLPDRAYRTLFGHVRRDSQGAITGFFPGYFQMATMLGGTVFVDEVNTLPDPSQVGLLLTVLEEPYSVAREGDSMIEQLNALVIFGSNKSPDQLMNDGWNPALFSRVNWFLEIPPFRERPEDIAALVNRSLIDALGSAKQDKHDLHFQRVSLEALRVLCEMRWRGNSRDITNFVKALARDAEVRGIRGDEITLSQVLACLRELGMI